MLIRAYDDKLLLSEVDQLFVELDESCNEVIFYEMLKKKYEDINEKDNPLTINEGSIERAASRHSSRTNIR